MASGTRTLKLSILADVASLNKELKKATGDVDDFGDKLSKAGKAIGVALAAAAAAAGAMAIKIGKDAVVAASNLAETTSKVGVIFGESSDEITKFAETAATALGQSQQQALDAASTFAIFGKSAGLAGEDLVSFSTDLVTLSADLASFYNTSPEDAINAIGSALRGEAEPLRKYGVLLDDATLRAKALELGIYNGSGALTSQQKVLAAHQVILAQTTVAQGDFERTSDGLANQQRILAAQLENTKVTIGTALLPVVLDMVSAFNRNVLPAIQGVANAIGEGGLDGLIKGVIDTIKKVFGPVLAGLRYAFDEIKSAIENNKEAYKALADFIKNVVAPVLGTTLGVALGAVGKVFATIIDIVGKAIDKIMSFIDAVRDMVNAVISAYNKLPTRDIGLIGASGSGAYSTSGGLGSAGGGAGGTGGFAGLGAGGGAGGAGGGGGAAGKTAAANVEAAKSLNDLVSKLTDLNENIGETIFQVETGGISKKAGSAKLAEYQAQIALLERQASAVGAVPSSIESTLGSFRRGESATMITVNMGIVGDPESAKRAMVDLMNDSTARGTLGAGSFKYSVDR
jgi:hypothetical protein